MNTLSQIISFLKYPNNENQKKSQKEKLILFSKLTLFHFAGVFVLIILLAILISVLNSYGIKIENKTNTDNLFSTYGKYSLLIAAVIAPIIEECVFRLPLSFSKRDIILSFFILTSVIGYKIMGNNMYLICLVISFSLILYGISQVSQDKLDKFKKRKGIIVFYIYTISFVLVHLTNFIDFQLNLLPVYILLMTPVILLSVNLAFCRMRIGFGYAILLHCLVNASTILI